MNKPVFVLERELSGSNREIVAISTDRSLIVEHIKLDEARFTLPVTYHISQHYPSYRLPRPASMGSEP